MRVAFFCHISGLGGAERSLLQLVGDLIGRHAVDCAVVFPREGPLVERLLQIGAQVDIVPYRWWTGGKPTDEAAWSRALEPSAENVVAYTLGTLRDWAPDVLVTHSIVTPWGAVAAALLDRPHAWHVCELPGGAFDFPFALSDALLIADIVRSANHLFMADALIPAERLIELAPERVSIVRRYIEPSPPDPAYVPPFRLAGAMRLGLFSSYNPLKGHMDAVRAVHALVAQGRAVELLCAGPTGNPAVPEELRAYIATHGLEARIQLLDTLPDPYDAMRACDILLALGRREAFGRTALEAMLLGKPVVYADDGLSFRYMRPGQTGLAYGPGDVGTLTAQLGRLLDDADLRRRLGAQARTYAEANFSRENFSGRFHRACRALVDDRVTARPMPRHIAPAVEAALARRPPA